MELDILGQKYKVEIHKISEDSYLEENGYCGYCSSMGKKIIVADVSENDYFPNMTSDEQELYHKETLRHEILHAFFRESGLDNSSNRSPNSWAKNEEMVDWFAIQAPKIFKAYQQANCL